MEECGIIFHKMAEWNCYGAVHLMKKRQPKSLIVETGLDRTDDRQFLVALARGLDVLKTIGQSKDTLGNAEIAEITGLSKATVSRLTYTLAVLGYIEYVEQLGRYRIGAGGVSLGYSALSGSVISHIARPYMKELADQSGLAVAMGTRFELQMVYLVNERSEDLVTLRLHPGSIIPMASTSMGHGYLATLAPENRKHLLQHLREQTTSGWRKAQAALQSNFELFSRAGFCAVVGLWHPHVNAVAVPLVPTDGTPTVVFSCGGLSNFASKDRLITELGPQLVHVVDRVTRALTRGIA
jgi:DNA-binding IclR family transcriptional regulator